MSFFDDICEEIENGKTLQDLLLLYGPSTTEAYVINVYNKAKSKSGSQRWRVKRFAAEGLMPNEIVARLGVPKTEDRKVRALSSYYRRKFGVVSQTVCSVIVDELPYRIPSTYIQFAPGHFMPLETAERLGYA